MRAESGMISSNTSRPFSLKVEPVSTISTMTSEEIEEEVQMVTDMMTKNGFSQQEIDEYIQQLRERYAQ